MKLLLLPLLLAGAGASWLGLGGATASSDECASDCRVTVECIGDDTCLVTCYEPDGSIRCQEEVTCDEPCDQPCDEPCEVSCDEPCEAPGAAVPADAATPVASPAMPAPACTPSPACAPSACSRQ